MNKRNVLLIEPNYKNKYPPMGLMKLSTYHRLIGDNVCFYKGELKELILEDIYSMLILKLKGIEENSKWPVLKRDILEYLKTGKKATLEKILNFSEYKGLIKENLVYYRKYYRNNNYLSNPKWDRICITTLFTFDWKITIEAINFAKKIIKNQKELWVGGIMASVLPSEIEKETGIKPWIGPLDKPGILDNNKIIIDYLELDYSILEEINYGYPIKNSYFSYMTRGCINRCKYCAVPIIEKKYIPYISLKKGINKSLEKYGEQKDLILLDNNVLASNRFNKIINEIKEIGFSKGAFFVEPNMLDLSIKNLRLGINDNAYIKKAYHLLNSFLPTLRNKKEKQIFYSYLKEYKILSLETTTKENLLEIYPLVDEIYKKRRNKKKKKRYIDFNQGLDARLLTPEKMKRLSELSLKPLRVAFDNIKDMNIYIKAIHLAKEYKFKELSNYILYNYKDYPIDLYKRLKINIDLCEGLGLNIYSFPMKYHPVSGEFCKNRDFIGKHWNKKFIRAVQVILNATKGKVGRGKDFFLKAFGKDENEFLKILYMPETFILYRFFFEDIGLTKKWWDNFNSLNETDKRIAKNIIEKNNFHNINNYYNLNSELSIFFKYYGITRDMVENRNSIFSNLKENYYKNKVLIN